MPNELLFVSARSYDLDFLKVEVNYIPIPVKLVEDCIRSIEFID